MSAHLHLDAFCDPCSFHADAYARPYPSRMNAGYVRALPRCVYLAGSYSPNAPANPC